MPDETALRIFQNCRDPLLETNLQNLGTEIHGIIPDPHAVLVGGGEVGSAHDVFF